MRRTGITPADLEEERQIGYQHGWNKENIRVSNSNAMRFNMLFSSLLSVGAGVFQFRRKGGWRGARDGGKVLAQVVEEFSTT